VDEVERFLIAFDAAAIASAPLAKVEMVFAAFATKPRHVRYGYSRVFGKLLIIRNASRFATAWCSAILDPRLLVERRPHGRALVR
jgi:hypothetical protein